MIHGIREELAVIAGQYMPLTEIVTEIEEQFYRQEICLERRFRLLLTEPRDPAAIRVETEGYEQVHERIDQEMENARAVLREAPALRGSWDREERTRLEMLLEKFDKERGDVRELGPEVAAALELGDMALFRKLLTLLRKQRVDCAKTANAILRGVERFVGDSLLSVKRQHETAYKVNVVLTATAALLGLLFAGWVTRRLVAAARNLLAGTRAVENGDLSFELKVMSRDELGALTEAFNRMIHELRLKEQIKSTFGKYVDPRIVERLISDGGMPQTEGERRVMTILFSDVVGFTTLSEDLTPSGLVKVINEYFTTMSEPIRANKGVIDKYIGDAIMAYWGPPFTEERDHARLACLAALAQMDNLRVLQERMPEIVGRRKGVPQIRMCIGISTGDVVVGNIGSVQAKNYTVLGDTVNLGSRLEGANRQYGTRILIAEETRHLAGDAVEAREIDAMQVKGKTEGVRVYELLGERGTLGADVLKLRDKFEEGLAAYRARRWDPAHSCFEACLGLKPDDGPSKVFLERSRYLRDHPPDDAWDGVWRFAEK
jgi:adenylate cyclase